MRILSRILRFKFPAGPRLNILLFLVTFLTTTIAGCGWAGVDPFQDPGKFYKGIPFSASLLGILLCHEFGHYLAARIHHTRASFPYFLPAPSYIGTFGAVIRIRSRIPSRRALLDVGVAGPLAGFIAAVGVTVYGLSRSTVGEISPGGLGLGSSLIFRFLGRIVLRVPANMDVELDPVAFSGWVALLVTMVNLFPVGQLDGGHIVYSLFGRHHRIVARIAAVVMFAMSFNWIGWILWGMIVLLIGVDHPPPKDDTSGLDWGRKLVGALALVILIITFVPAPVEGWGVLGILQRSFLGR